MFFENDSVLEPFRPRQIKLGENEARIYSLLRDFSTQEKEEEAIETSFHEQEMEPFLFSDSDENISFSQHEMEAAKLASFAAGLAQGKKEAQATLEQQFEEERLTWEEGRIEEIEEVQKKTIANLANNLDANLQMGLDDIKRSLEHDLANMMRDIVGTYLTKQALGDFVAKIVDEAISSREPIIIEGKQELLDVFAEKTTLKKDSYQLQPISSAEIRVILADKVISTRLASLMQELKALF